MKKIVPSFEVNLAYKTRKASDLFSFTSKPYLEMAQVPSTVYQFNCDCRSHYIGQTVRPLLERMQEHQQPSRAKGILLHIVKCPVYQDKLKLSTLSPTIKASFEFYKKHFKIVRKGFRSQTELRRTEAFYIRVKKPDLNDHKDHNFFKLFYMRMP